MQYKGNFFVCAECVGEQFLKAAILENGAEENCYNCNRKGKAISIGELAGRVKTVLENYYKPAPEHLFLNRDLIENVIADAAKIDVKIATAVREVLAKEHSGSVARENRFDEDAVFIGKAVDDNELRQEWNQAQISLKAKTRYFNRDAEKILDDIFNGLFVRPEHDGSAAVVRHIDKPEEFPIYRARVFQSATALKEALARPDVHLGPPSADVALAGRMNASGISVFYGASSIDLAIVEVRPPVNSRVVVGRFLPLGELRLLDVKALRKVNVEGSVFDPEHLDKAKRAIFLERLSKGISMPIMPDDAPLEYVVTQAIADYLGDRTRFNLDGILYPPQNTDIAGSNVMLFNSASRVKPMVVPENTEIKVDTNDTLEESTSEPEYRVIEEITRESIEKSEMYAEIKTESAHDFRHATPQPHDLDAREMTLKLDVNDVIVYHIGWPDYAKRSYPVERCRQEHDPIILAKKE